jgi:hypothetical protein
MGRYHGDEDICLWLGLEKMGGGKFGVIGHRVSPTDFKL